MVERSRRAGRRRRAGAINSKRTFLGERERAGLPVPLSRQPWDIVTLSPPPRRPPPRGAQGWAEPAGCQRWPLALHRPPSAASPRVPPAPTAGTRRMGLRGSGRILHQGHRCEAPSARAAAGAGRGLGWSIPTGFPPAPLRALTGGRCPGAAPCHQRRVPAASAAPTAPRSRHMAMPRSCLRRRHRGARCCQIHHGPARRAPHRRWRSGGERSPIHPCLQPLPYSHRPGVPPAPGPSPAPSRSRQPPCGFLPQHRDIFLPEARTAGREGGVSGERRPPGFPCMGSISCTKTETKPQRQRLSPLLRPTARSGGGESWHRCRGRRSPAGCGQCPQRLQREPGRSLPLSAFLFRGIISQ